MTRQYSEIRFNRVSFTAAQSCSLLHCNEISLSHCTFYDGGDAIIEAIDKGKDLCKLHWKKLQILGCNPFNDRNFSLLLNDNKLNQLGLGEMGINKEVRQGFMTGQITRLHLYKCKLDDEGTSLLECVQKGMGPRELFWFYNDSFLIPLINALRSNTYLQNLSLRGVDQNVCFWHTLAASLRENKGLRALSINVCFPSMAHTCDLKSWNQLMEALVEHPSLLSVSIHCTAGIEENDEKVKIDRTKALAKMLNLNSRIEEFTVSEPMRDKDEWDATVAVKLQHNRWRNLLQAMLSCNHRPSTRAALIGQALVLGLRNKPWACWFTLCHGSDTIVCSYLEQQACVTSSF